MDLSALIFVALAIAWAVYLIPKALRHHEDSTASRTVEGFSDRMRVLAHREPVDSRTARLVVNGAKPAPPVALEKAAKTEKTAKTAKTAKPAPAARPAVTRAAARRAARRRLRVVLLILAALVTVTVLAASAVVGWTWVAAPGGALVAWLVACRLMVKRERAVAVPSRRLPIVTEEPDTDDGGPVTEEIVAIDLDLPEAADDADEAPAPTDPDGWDLVPVTLPTYVDKAPAARRSVRTIDLDSTGVWTSGRTAADSALAREADAVRERPASTSEQKRRA